MRFVRMQPGHGDVLIAEGDVDVAAEEERLVAAFREQLDQGMWAAVPEEGESNGSNRATMIREFKQIPRNAERVIFFPKAAGG